MCVIQDRWSKGDKGRVRKSGAQYTGKEESEEEMESVLPKIASAYDHHQDRNDQGRLDAGG